MTVDAQILTALRAATGEPVSGADLAAKLGISRAAVWARIQELRGLGYDIAARPHLGYRLVGAPDVLHADDLISRLGATRVIGRAVQVFQETTSTNDMVERLARDGVREGVVVLAESQTKGRGRLGRSWASTSRKGLLLSILLRPMLSPLQATRLTIMAATAVARGISATTGLSPGVKWPNDILLNGRKVAGILTELSAEVDHVKHVIIGIGLNVNQSPGDFPREMAKIASSLRIEADRLVDRAELAVSLLRELDADYERACTGKFEAVADEWEALSVTLGHEVSILSRGSRIRGRAESLDADGALLVRTQHGRIERVVGGDVTLDKGP